MKAAAAVTVVLLAGLAAGCAGSDGVEPVAATSCARLLYEGDGEPDVVVVSDFPLRGIGAQTTRLMVDAIEFVFRQHDFRAGDHRVGYQSCNDTIGDEPYDPLLCRQNARAYVATKDVVGIIGPWNSGCASEQIPIVSRRMAGPLAMISPSNTFVGLTRTIPGEASGTALYPDGVRSYARVVTHDQAQGIAAAHLVARLGARRAVVVHQDLADVYVRGLTLPFVRAAKGLGLEALRVEWPLRQSYTQLAADVAAARPDVVFMAGLTQENAKTLVEDLRAELGPEIPLLAPDSFAVADVARELGAAGEGMFVTVPGIPPEALPPAGRQFLREFGRAFVERGQLGAPEAAQATEVLLDAIGRSDGTRASVVHEIFATKVENGILGSFSFDRFGDIVPAPVGIYRFRDQKIVVESVVRAPLDAIGG
ncbi:MAG: branched-chain amino acid ABC transporter substrate-binding protein [Gaiellaceae bacterium]